MAGKRVKKREKKRKKRLPGVAVLTAAALLIGLCAPVIGAVSAQRAAKAAQLDLEEQLPTAESPDAAQTELLRKKRPEIPVPEVPTPVVPESDPVEDTYFDDAVFLGDSRTQGLELYSGLTNGTYLCAVGATAESVFTKATEETEQGKLPILDALANLDCGKVYIMLGINELGWPNPDTFRQQYGKVIDRIRADHPGIIVAIESLLPVSALQEAKGSYVNNERIAQYNEILLELAEEKDCPYLNVAETVRDEDGCLRADWNFDGVHLNPSGCAAWRKYLETHPVDAG